MADKIADLVISLEKSKEFLREIDTNLRMIENAIVRIKAVLGVEG